MRFLTIDDQVAFWQIYLNLGKITLWLEKKVVYLPCQKYVVGRKKGIDAIKKSPKNALHTSAMKNSHKKFLMQKIKGNNLESPFLCINFFFKKKKKIVPDQLELQLIVCHDCNTLVASNAQWRKPSTKMRLLQPWKVGIWQPICWSPGKHWKNVNRNSYHSQHPPFKACQSLFTN